MKKFPIKIRGLNNYTQVALFIDQPDVQNDVYKLKKEFKVKNAINFELETLKKHFITLAGFDPQKYPSSKKTTITSEGFTYLFEEPDRLLDYLIEHHDEIENHKNVVAKVHGLEQRFFTNIGNTRRKYGYPPMFDTVLIQAVLFDKITVFKSAYPTFFYRPALPHESSMNPNTKRDIVMAIAVIPTSIGKDIMSAFRALQNGLRDVAQAGSPLDKKIDKRAFPKIIKHRDWYWMHHKSNPKRLGYLKMSKIVGENTQTIRSGINAYKSLLTSPL
jgi:hypothetical protein